MTCIGTVSHCKKSFSPAPTMNGRGQRHLPYTTTAGVPDNLKATHPRDLRATHHHTPPSTSRTKYFRGCPDSVSPYIIPPENPPVKTSTCPSPPHLPIPARSYENSVVHLGQSYRLLPRQLPVQQMADLGIQLHDRHMCDRRLDPRHAKRTFHGCRTQIYQSRYTCLRPPRA